MRAMLHGPAFTSYAGRFVWLGINFDDPRNEAFLAAHVTAFPVLAIIDPETEQVTKLWAGTATVDQIRGFLDAPPDDAIARGDALLGKGDGDGATKAYDEAVARGGSGQPHALEQLATALQLGDSKTCASRLAAAAPAMPRTHPFVNVVVAGAQCAAGDPAIAASADGQKLEALAGEALALPVTSEDDHYQIYESLYRMRTSAGDAAGGKAIAERYLAFIDQLPTSTSDDERMARDLARVRATIKLGTPDKAIAILEASERALATDPGASVRLATAYAAAGRDADAIAAATRALARNPTPTEAARLHVLRATASTKRGDVASARRDLEAALAIVPKIPVAMMRPMMTGQIQHQLDALAQPPAPH